MVLHSLASVLVSVLQPRYWTPEEHRLFMEAVQRYGWKDVKSIAQHVGTRTPTQVRTHAQKLFLRQQKEQTGAHWEASGLAY